MTEYKVGDKVVTPGDDTDIGTIVRVEHGTTKYAIQWSRFDREANYDNIDAVWFDSEIIPAPVAPITFKAGDRVFNTWTGPGREAMVIDGMVYESRIKVYDFYTDAGRLWLITDVRKVG